MTEFVALLRAVNVGGVRIAMADLVAIADGLGWGEAETFVNSGNLLFTADAPPVELAAALEGILRARYGHEVPVVVRDRVQMQALVGECPFKPVTGSHVHAFIPFGPFAPDQALADSLRAQSEELAFTPSAVWLHTPEGVGRSALARRIEAVAGTRATGRNLNSLRKLADLLDAREGG